jgi:hypothetical protein
MKNQAKLVYTKALLNQIAFPVNQTIVYSCRYDSLDLLLSTILEKWISEKHFFVETDIQKMHYMYIYSVYLKT